MIKHRYFAFVTLIAFAASMLCPTPLRAQEARSSLQVIIKDPNGDVITDARISINSDKNFKQDGKTNEQGQFRFINLPVDSYLLKVTASGFAPYEQTVKVSYPPASHTISITLQPMIKEVVIIDEGASKVALDPQNAVGSQLLKEKDLQALPDDPDQFAEQLKLLATSSGSAPGDATFTVDGFTVEGRLPPKSTIREVRINPDLFSAEYDKAPYQGGRVEIYTKPGSLAFTGSAFFNYNNSVLNARDAFALTHAPSSTGRYGLEMGTPIIKKRMGLLGNFEKREINESATVNALVLSINSLPASFVANVPTQKRLLLGSLRFDWQANTLNTITARYDFNSDRSSGQGVGGFNLPDRAFSTSVVENSLKLADTTVINPKLFNEARFALTRLILNQNAASSEPAINVFGAFNSGGANLQAQRREEWRVEVADIISVVNGRHSLKLGSQVFGKWLDDLRADNFNGTYVFGGSVAPRLDSHGQVIIGPAGPELEAISGLEQYRRTLLGLPGGRPTRFSINVGNPSAGVSQWRLAGFVQDEWRLRANLSASLGLRYEAQTNPGNKISLGPRFGLAYSPDKKRRWVLRGRAGIFYDRISESLPLEAAHLDGVQKRQLLIDSPSFPDPFLDASGRSPISTVRRLSDHLRPPTSFQTQLALEHQLSGAWKLQVSHSWSYGWYTLRSLNINAPLVNGLDDPSLAPRPLGIPDNVLEFESSGRLNGSVTFIGMNQARNKYFNLYSGYLFFNFHANADSSATLPQSSYSLDGEWARPVWQSRHRAFIVALVNLPSKVRASLSFNAASGTPFNITTGRDNNGDGNFNDRPDIVDFNDPGAIFTTLGAFDINHINGSLPRNWGTNPSTSTVDLNLSRSFVLNNSSPGGTEDRDARLYRLTLNARASNLLNRTNLTGLNGVLISPFFGRANSSSPARRVEFGLRFSF